MTPEIQKLLLKIEMLEKEKHEMVVANSVRNSHVVENQPNTRELDISILEDEINQVTLQYNNLLQLQEYQKLCNHVFIDDLIDITPDTSKTIQYCAHCLFTYENSN